MNRTAKFAGLAVTLAAITGYAPGMVPMRPEASTASPSVGKPTQPSTTADALLPAVTVAAAGPATFIDSILVNGSLVARNEVLIAPEVEGLRITELGAEEGDRVAKGQPPVVTSKLCGLPASVSTATAPSARRNSVISRRKAIISSNFDISFLGRSSFFSSFLSSFFSSFLPDGGAGGGP